jgi:hypothetical protein
MMHQAWTAASGTSPSPTWSRPLPASATTAKTCCELGPPAFPSFSHSCRRANASHNQVPPSVKERNTPGSVLAASPPLTLEPGAQGGTRFVDEGPAAFNRFQSVQHAAGPESRSQGRISETLETIAHAMKTASGGKTLTMAFYGIFLLLFFFSGAEKLRSQAT